MNFLKMMKNGKKEFQSLNNQVFDRKSRERFLNQRSRVIWLSGLSGSGKTTIACNIELELNKQGYISRLLDAESIRSGINNNLGFNDYERLENIRRVSEISRLFIDCGIICINSFITPTEKIRNLGRNIIGRENLVEIFVNAPIDVCEKRDVKGLYKQVWLIDLLFVIFSRLMADTCRI